MEDPKSVSSDNCPLFFFDIGLTADSTSSDFFHNSYQMHGDQHVAALDYIDHLQGTAAHYPNIANATYVYKENANNLMLDPGITIGGQFAQDLASHLMAALEMRLEDSETIISTSH
jgi:hypothetical protein